MLSEVTVVNVVVAHFLWHHQCAKWPYPYIINDPTCLSAPTIIPSCALSASLFLFPLTSFFPCLTSDFASRLPPSVSHLHSSTFLLLLFVSLLPSFACLPPSASYFPPFLVPYASTPHIHHSHILCSFSVQVEWAHGGTFSELIAVLVHIHYCWNSHSFSSTIAMDCW